MLLPLFLLPWQTQYQISRSDEVLFNDQRSPLEEPNLLFFDDHISNIERLKTILLHIIGYEDDITPTLKL